MDQRAAVDRADRPGLVVLGPLRGLDLEHPAQEVAEGTGGPGLDAGGADRVQPAQAPCQLVEAGRHRREVAVELGELPGRPSRGRLQAAAHGQVLPGSQRRAEQVALVLCDLPRLVDAPLGQVEHHRPVRQRRLGRDQAGEPGPALRVPQLPQLGRADPPAGQFRDRVEQPAGGIGGTLLGVVGGEAEDGLPAGGERAQEAAALAGQPARYAAERVLADLPGEDRVDRGRRGVGALGHAQDVDAVEGHPGDARDRPGHEPAAQPALGPAPG